MILLPYRLVHIFAGQKMGEIPTRCSASSFVTAYLFKSLELSDFRTRQDSQYQNCRLPCYPLSGPGPDARPFVGEPFRCEFPDLCHNYA
jgi:hypothetical protein